MMGAAFWAGKRESGVTLIELLLAVVIFGILASIAIPNFSVWLHNYRLRSAARDLYSNMQLAKLKAIKQNQNCSITFSSNPDRYTGSLADKTVYLDEYGSGVKFDDPTHTKTFEVATLTFNSSGFSNAGYVYLSNQKNTAYYRVSPSPSGVIKLQKWNGVSWE